MMRFRGVVVAAIAASVTCVGVLACSGSDTSSPIGSSDSGPTGDGGAGDGATYTLDNVCDLIPPKICGIDKACCEQTGGFDQAGCEAHSKADCEKDVAEVRAGRETFHPEKLDPCAVTLKSILDEGCYATFDLILDVAAKFGDCRIFEGSLAEAASCERGSQCKAGAGPNDIVGCSDKNKVCTTTHILAEGATCTIADNLPSVCGKGLYCDADISLKPPSGTCKKSTPIGSACSTSKTFDLECGFGNYCDAATAKCTVGKPANAACTTDLECQSIACKGLDGGVDAGKTCTSVDPVVKTEECKGL